MFIHCYIRFLVPLPRFLLSANLAINRWDGMSYHNGTNFDSKLFHNASDVSGWRYMSERAGMFLLVNIKKKIDGGIPNLAR